MFVYAFGVFSGAEGGEEEREEQRGGTVSRSPSLHTPPCFKRTAVNGDKEAVGEVSGFWFSVSKGILRVGPR